MKSLEYYLTEHLFFEKLYKSFISVSSNSIEGTKFTIEVSLGDEVKKYSVDLSKKLWNTFEYTYEILCGTDLMRQGYYLLTIEGGWIVTKEGGEAYQLGEDSCTCNQFLFNGSERCKHLIFRDMMIKYNARCRVMERRYK